MVDEETVVWDVLAPLAEAKLLPLVTILAVVYIVEFPFPLAMLTRVSLVLNELELTATDQALLLMLEELVGKAELCASGLALAAATVELVETVA